MRGNIISYDYLCQKESAKLQKGMNFRLKGKHSVILMSVRKNSPYQDEITEDGTVLIYEGHDVPKTEGITYPSSLISLNIYLQVGLQKTVNLIGQPKNSNQG